jgi:hypothetical protein
MLLKLISSRWTEKVVELNLPKLTTSRRDLQVKSLNAIDYTSNFEGKKSSTILIAEDVYYPVKVKLRVLCICFIK